jgi:hypothetical protein
MYWNELRSFCLLGYNAVYSKFRRNTGYEHDLLHYVHLLDLFFDTEFRDDLLLGTLVEFQQTTQRNVGKIELITTAVRASVDGKQSIAVILKINHSSIPS